MSVSILLRGRNQTEIEFLASAGSWKVGEIALVGDKIYVARDTGTKVAGEGSEGPGVRFYTFTNTATIGDGFAPLEGGKIPVQYMPLSTLLYKGVWDATTNTPELPATDLARVGNFYIASGTGTLHGLTFETGDWLLYNSDGNLEKSDNTDDVVTVNGQKGAVVLDTDDIAEGTNNQYYTTARAQTAARSAVSGAGSVSYDSGTGVFTLETKTITNAASTPLTGAQVISQVTIGSDGLVSDVASRDLTAADVGAASDSHTHAISEVTDLQTSLDAKAADTTVVKLSGDQTVAGVKTFSALPVLPDVDPTLDNQVARKKYVDDGLATKVATDDARLSDARTPTAHTHAISEVTDLQTTLNAKEGTVTAGTTADYYRGDKTWQALNTDAVVEDVAATNQYFTTERAATAAKGAISGAGVISVTDGVVAHTDSETVRHVSDTEKTTWNAKVGEAPEDSQPYVRVNGAWFVLDEISGGDF